MIEMIGWIAAVVLVAAWIDRVYYGRKPRERPKPYRRGRR